MVIMSHDSLCSAWLHSDLESDRQQKYFLAANLGGSCDLPAAGRQ
jgi:hypothetical protein